jgi:glycosyltransferase involved in cell wall biosynthesis
MGLLKQRFQPRESSFHFIPVGSNITTVTVDEQEKAELRSELGLTSEHFVVTTFGSMIGQGVVFLKTFLKWLANVDPLARFLFLGKDSELLKQQFNRDTELQKRIIATGKIPETQISPYLSLSNLFAVFYPDGASTRRTSFIVGLAHGIPTISNLGLLTNKNLISSNAACLLKDVSEEELTELKSCLGDRKWLENMGRQARSYFEKNLSWPKIAADYCHLLNGSTE